MVCLVMLALCLLQVPHGVPIGTTQLLQVPYGVPNDGRTADAQLVCNKESIDGLLDCK